MLSRVGGGQASGKNSGKPVSSPLQEVALTNTNPTFAEQRSQQGTYL